MTDREPFDAAFEWGPLVASGGFAQVYRARHVASNTTVALKRLYRDAEDPTLRERFEREAAILAAIRSEYVVRYVSHGLDRHGRPCLALEWLEGDDLSKRQARQPMTVDDVVEFARQAALGLAAVHAHGVVHRDVKPSNFFLVPSSDSFVVKLLDLGVARWSERTALTVGNVRLGTPPYMSPEQVSGTDPVTNRSDLFSLGTVLYELLVGQRPFRANDPYALLAKIALEPAVPLRSIRPAVPADVEMLVLRALAKSPAERFDSAEEMADVFARVQSPASAAASRRDEPRPVEVARHEQRVVTVVFGVLPESEGAGSSAGDALREIAQRHAGAIQRVLGGRVAVIFGETRTRGDESRRAARMALDAQSAVPGLRLAIATGRARSDREQMLGEAIDRAASAAELGAEGIRIDAATESLLASHFEIEGAPGERRLRAVEGGQQDSHRLLGRATPFVGRDRELALLGALFEECVSEPAARVALVTGAPGVGKSRLCEEFVRRVSARADAPTVLIGRGQPLSAGSPFAPIAGVIRTAAEIDERDPAPAALERLRSRIARSVAPDDLERVLRGLASIARAPLGEQPESTERVFRGDAQQIGDVLRSAWEDWLSAECGIRPVLLVLDDMHWGDIPTVEFVDASLRQLERRPFMVVALARPEIHARAPALWSQRGAHVMPLGGLTRRASEQLVRAALGDDAPDATVAGIVSRANGDPFCTEELIRAHVAGRGAFLPDTVVGSIQIRLDELGPAARRVARAASVFGDAFWSGALSEVLSEPTAALAPAVDELLRHEIVRSEPLPRFRGEAEYRFHHALVREASYAMLTDEDRTTCHRRAGEWLLSAGERDPVVLAQHFELGRESERARDWYRRAAVQALSGNDYAAAIDRAERAIEAGASGHDRGVLRLVQAEAHRCRSEAEMGSVRAREAAENLDEGSPEWLQAIGETFVLAGYRADIDAIRRAADQLTNAPFVPQTESARVVALCRAVQPLISMGCHPETDVIFTQIARLADSGAALDAAARAQIHRAHLSRAYRDGDVGALLAHAESALLAFEEAGDRRRAAANRGELASACLEAGDAPRARRYFDEAIPAAQRLGLDIVVAHCKPQLALAIAWLGSTEEAMSVARHAVQLGAGVRNPQLEGLSHTNLARIAILRGQFDVAREAAARAIERLGSYTPMLIGAYSVLSLAELGMSNLEGALAAARTADTKLQLERGTGPTESLARLAFVEALLAAGEVDGARAAVVVARASLMARSERLGQPSLREMFLRSVPEHARTLALFERLTSGAGSYAR